MMDHLSDDQISLWVAGERTSEAEGHVNDCVHCAGEIAQLEGAIGGVSQSRNRMECSRRISA